jgi:fucose 4-O-acetylase-like acetyltransferase
VEELILTMIRQWPGTTRSLLLLLRLTCVAITPVILVVVWRLMSVLPWTIDGLFALLACFAFAYVFERGERE